MNIIRILAILLILGMAGTGAYFYMMIHQPMADDYARMKSEIPELEKARAELKKYRERERWIPPAVESIKAGLKEEIEGGMAEVVSAEDRIIINIKEEALYTPESVTFSNEGTPTREKIASLLKDLKDIKDKEIYVANTTRPVAEKRKGARKIPARTALEIASDRSAALVKFFESKGVPKGALSAVAYPDRMPDYGFGIKADKTVIIIANPPVLRKDPGIKPARQPAPAAQEGQPQTPKPIPIQPAPPRQQ